MTAKEFDPSNRGQSTTPAADFRAVPAPTTGRSRFDTPARPMLSLKGVQTKFAVCERTAYGIVAEEWFPKPFVHGGRVRRWIESEIDEALATRAPRATERSEPVQLLKARKDKLAGRQAA